MKQNEITIGGYYRAKVNNKIVTVRVDAIESRYGGGWTYTVQNLSTGRSTAFRSAAKFRAPATFFEVNREIVTVMPGSVKQCPKWIREEATDGPTSVRCRGVAGHSHPCLPPVRASVFLPRDPAGKTILEIPNKKLD